MPASLPLLLPIPDVVALLMPAFPKSLFSAEAQAQVLATAAGLPPTSLGGFEFRLAADAPQVDLGLAYQVSQSGELALHTGQKQGKGWEHLHQFLVHSSQQVTEPSAPAFGLEFDSPIGGSHAPTPLVFCEFRRDQSVQDNINLGLAEFLVPLVGQARAEQFLVNFQRCLPPPDLPIHFRGVGVMLGRDVNIMRMLVQSFPLARLPAYLRHLEWAGSIDDLMEQMGWMQRYTEHFLYHLDVGEQVGPRVGISPLPTRTTKHDKQYHALLDELVVRDWATPEKRIALNHIQSVLTPLKSKSPWIEGLIVESLRRPSTDLSQFHLQLSDVKLSYVPGQLMEVKAYVLFEHHWQLTSVPPTLA